MRRVGRHPTKRPTLVSTRTARRRPVELTYRLEIRGPLARLARDELRFRRGRSGVQGRPDGGARAHRRPGGAACCAAQPAVDLGSEVRLVEAITLPGDKVRGSPVMTHGREQSRVGRVRALARQYSTTTFFLLTFLITWALWVPRVLAPELRRIVPRHARGAAGNVGVVHVGVPAHCGQRVDCDPVPRLRELVGAVHAQCSRR